MSATQDPSQAYSGKMFIGGLASSTSQSSMRNYFEKYGEVIDCVIMVDRDTKESRGFGFVTMQQGEAVNVILEDAPHILDGKQIDCKKAVPKEGQACHNAISSPSQQSAQHPASQQANQNHGKKNKNKNKQKQKQETTTQLSPQPQQQPQNAKQQHAQALTPQGQQLQPKDLRQQNTSSPKSAESSSGQTISGDSQYRKIFVGGLPHNLCIEEFRSYFEQFGQLEDCVILQDKRTQKPRGFGFVTYKDINDLDKVMARVGEHQIQGKWIECKRSVSINQMKEHSGHEKGYQQDQQTDQQTAKPVQGASNPSLKASSALSQPLPQLQTYQYNQQSTPNSPFGSPMDQDPYQPPLLQQPFQIYQQQAYQPYSLPSQHQYSIKASQNYPINQSPIQQQQQLFQQSIRPNQQHNLSTFGRPQIQDPQQHQEPPRQYSPLTGQEINNRQIGQPFYPGQRANIPPPNQFQQHQFPMYQPNNYSWLNQQQFTPQMAQVPQNMQQQPQFESGFPYSQTYRSNYQPGQQWMHPGMMDPQNAQGMGHQNEKIQREQQEQTEWHIQSLSNMYSQMHVDKEDKKIEETRCKSQSSDCHSIGSQELMHKQRHNTIQNFNEEIKEQENMNQQEKFSPSQDILQWSQPSKTNQFGGFYTPLMGSQNNKAKGNYQQEEAKEQQITSQETPYSDLIQSPSKKENEEQSDDENESTQPQEQMDRPSEPEKQPEASPFQSQDLSQFQNLVQREQSQVYSSSQENSLERKFVLGSGHNFRYGKERDSSKNSDQSRTTNQFGSIKSDRVQANSKRQDRTYKPY